MFHLFAREITIFISDVNLDPRHSLPITALETSNLQVAAIKFSQYSALLFITNIDKYIDKFTLPLRQIMHFIRLEISILRLQTLCKTFATKYSRVPKGHPPPFLVATPPRLSTKFVASRNFPPPKLQTSV